MLNIKIATEPWEFDAIHRFNYETFVEEIPQHQANDEKILVDRFHHENTYIIAIKNGELLGMLALRGKRPFSLDEKLENLSQYLPDPCLPVEIRLLAIRHDVRKTKLFIQLIGFSLEFALSEGFDYAVISGTTQQIKLYQHLGFIPFGQQVGTPDACYQPMYLSLEAYLEKIYLNTAFEEELQNIKVRNFLPGPVYLSDSVQKVLHHPCFSHRSSRFVKIMAQVQQQLCALTGARYAQVLLGSGTLANDVVAAQLSLLGSKGLIISNGEFGERLVNQARRAQLTFENLAYEWHTPFNLDEIESLLNKQQDLKWVWFVHHETSTGCINPLRALSTLCREFNLLLCADCISSLGAMPVNLQGCYLATGSANKGLGSYPGLSIVFHREKCAVEPERLPAYLDLGYWASKQSIPFTHSSNLLLALHLALKEVTIERMQQIQEKAVWLQIHLRNAGFQLILPSSSFMGPVLTLKMPSREIAQQLGDEMGLRGFWLSYESSYLSKRAWIQIALLGNPPWIDLEKLLQVLKPVYSRLCAKTSKSQT